MRHRRRVGHKGSRRKMHWETGSQWSEVEADVSNATINISWAKWPSATIDDSSDVVPFDYLTQKDETLIRTHFSGFCYVDAPSLEARTVVLGFGLVAWDSVNPENEHKQNYPAGLYPSPISDGALDWVHRKIVSGKVEGAVGFSTDLVATSMDMSDLSLQSRAMRKLPPGTGLLMCLELQMPRDSIETTGTLTYWFEYRMLFKDP